MHAFHGFFPRPEEGTMKIPREWAEASDWFVLFTLGTLFFLLGAFAMWAWFIWRRSTRPEPHIRLLMELEQEAGEEAGAEAHRTPSDESADTAAPWEQPDDWWKKADS